MKGLFERAEWARASGYTRRYHGWRVLLEDPVGLHERNVVKIIMLIDPNASRELILHALGHDDAEWIVGDMPAPAKRLLPDYIVDNGPDRLQGRKSFREVFGEMEDKVLAEAGHPLPAITTHEAWLLKFADSMDGLLYCYQEIAMGNTYAIEVWRAYDTYLTKLLDEGPNTLSFNTAQNAIALHNEALANKGIYRGR